VTPSRDELRAQLEGLDAPSPRPDFVRRLEARLQSIDPTAADAAPASTFRRRNAAPGFLALGAVAVLVAVLFLVLPRADDNRLGVTGRPPIEEPGAVETPGGTTVPATGTTTTAPGVTATTTVVRTDGAPTTTRAGAPNSGGSQAVPSLPQAPVTSEPTATTRPRPAPTTTTTKQAEPEVLAITCAGGQPEGQPGVQCDWSQSTSPAFASYKVWRATGTEARQLLTTIPVRTITRYIDRPGTGVFKYMVEAVDGQGRIVGRSTIFETSCC
jgi:hypothetical protein